MILLQGIEEAVLGESMVPTVAVVGGGFLITMRLLCVWKGVLVVTEPNVPAATTVRSIQVVVLVMVVKGTLTHLTRAQVPVEMPVQVLLGMSFSNQQMTAAL